MRIDVHASQFMGNRMDTGVPFNAKHPEIQARKSSAKQVVGNVC